MGASLCPPHSSPGFLPAGWRGVWCDRQIPRDDREPFIRTDFNATLPVGNMFWLSGLSHWPLGPGGQIQMLPIATQTSPQSSQYEYLSITRTSPPSAAAESLFLMGTASLLVHEIMGGCSQEQSMTPWGKSIKGQPALQPPPAFLWALWWWWWTEDLDGTFP